MSYISKIGKYCNSLVRAGPCPIENASELCYFRGMKIAIAQMSPCLGKVEKNLALHLSLIEKAKKAGAGLIVFPELSLTGYMLRDMVEEVSLDPGTSPILGKIASKAGDISVVLGFVEENRAEKGVFYNSAAFLSEGKVLNVHRKVYLPTTGMFEEARFFGAGKQITQFRTPFGRVGLLICRDFLHIGASYVHFAGGADMTIIISAAPGRGVSGGKTFDSGRMWELMGESVSYFATCFVVYANRVGVEDGLTFAGGSFIYAPGGRRLAKAAEVDPDLLIQEIDLEAVREARRKWTFKRDERPEVIFRSLENILRVTPED